MNTADFKNKKVLIMGLGLHGGGLSIAKWLAKQGAELRITDLKSREELQPSLQKLKNFKKIKYTLGRHKKEDFKWADMIIQNPGVPRQSEFLKYAQKIGKRIENEASLFFQLCPAPIIGVTGTRGKSTTTFLIYKIFVKRDKNILVAGNIRINAMFDVIDKVKPEIPVVLELSSWHLEGMAKIKKSPHIAVVTNIMPDHLNRYRNIKSYAAAKKNIFKFQDKKDFIVLNFDNKFTKEMGKEAVSQRYWFSKKYFPGQNGCFIKNNWLYFRRQGKEQKICSVKNIKLKGQHNLENVLAAVAVCGIYNIDKEKVKNVLSEFSGIPHRQEIVRVKNGVKFVNDTTATTPDATIAALKVFDHKNIVLIAGGSDKGLDYKNLALEIKKKTKGIILLQGAATDKLSKELEKLDYNGCKVETNNLKSAVLWAHKFAKKGDTVLFSPGAASFGLFANEFERGERFKKIVKGLK